MNNFIELKNLSKTFFDKKNINVLKKINFKFKLGKIYSLMGPAWLSDLGLEIPSGIHVGCF